MTSQPMGGPSDEFLLPDVGEGLDSAEIVEWLVGEGETVERDQPLVEILTDKLQAVGMQFGGDVLFEKTIRELVDTVR